MWESKSNLTWHMPSRSPKKCMAARKLAWKAGGTPGEKMAEKKVVQQDQTYGGQKNVTQDRANVTQDRAK